MKIKQCISLTALIQIANLAFYTQAYAQEETLEEVVVTARFRSESVQDIGASISAMGSEQIESLGLATVGDLAAFAPGLNLADRGPGRNDVNVRGIGRLIGFQDLAPTPQSVGVYYDDVPINIAAGTQLDVLFFDIDRVEVLRGPQGTLYGESSTGGTVLYKGKDPVLSEFGGQIEADVNSIDGGGTEYGIRGVVNIPLSNDKAAIRLLANRTAQDGFIDNSTYGADDLNDFETNHYRATLLAEASENLTFRVSGIYEERDSGATWLESGDPSNKEFLFFDNRDDYIEEEYSLVSFRADWQLDNLNLQWVTGYFDRSIERDVYDAVPAAFITSLTLPAGIAADGRSQDQTDYEQLSQEIRLVSQFDGSLNFVAGAFYKDSDQIITGLATSEELLLLGLPTNLLYDVYVYDSETEQVSAFGEIYYKLNEQLTLTAGLRYHDETIDVVSPPNNFASFGLTLPPVDTSVDVDEWLPKFSIEYTPNEDMLFFAGVSTGIRNGNTNFTSTLGFAELFGIDVTGKETYGDDAVTAYEVGAKFNLLDNALTLNGSVYYNDWEDLQVAVAQATLGLIENVGDAYTMGFELEARWSVSDQVSLFALGNWTEAETDEDFVTNLDSAPPGITPEGTDIPYTPEYTLATGAEYSLNFGSDSQLVLRGTYRYTGDYATAFEDNAPVLGGFGVLDLAAAYSTNNWRATLRLSNATDENEIVSLGEFDSAALSSGGILPPGLSYNQTYTNRPRTLSLNVSYTF